MKSDQRVTPYLDAQDSFLEDNSDLENLKKTVLERASQQRSNFQGYMLGSRNPKKPLKKDYYSLSQSRQPAMMH